VNPYDLEGVARAVNRAFHWDKVDRRRMMVGLRDHVRSHNIFWWVDSFLQASFSTNLGDFPPVDTVQFEKI
jgi:trehalose 6-phosphate synthase